MPYLAHLNTMVGSLKRLQESDQINLFKAIWVTEMVITELAVATINCSQIKCLLKIQIIND
jgi:hypothetical protein